MKIEDFTFNFSAKQTSNLLIKYALNNASSILALSEMVCEIHAKTFSKTKEESMAEFDNLRGDLLQELLLLEYDSDGLTAR